jgi:hypothetical protein
MGNWWANKKVLVSPRWIERISWSESTVFVSLSSRLRRSIHVDAANGRPWAIVLAPAYRPMPTGSKCNKPERMMSHMNGWTNGWGGGEMWVIGVLLVVLLIVIIRKMDKRELKQASRREEP